MHFLFTHFPPDVLAPPGGAAPGRCLELLGFAVVFAHGPFRAFCHIADGGLRGALNGVGHQLRVLAPRRAEHPVRRVVIRVGRLAHAQADARELVRAQRGDYALEAVVAPGAAAVRMRTEPGGRAISSENTSTRSGGSL